MPPVSAPPQTIQVSLMMINVHQSPPLTPYNQIVFTFNPFRLDLPNTGGSEVTDYQVTFDLVSNIPGAVLTHEDSDTNPPADLVSTDPGTSLTITFSNQGLATPETLHYGLTARAFGELLHSGDPELVIPPPN